MSERIDKIKAMLKQSPHDCFLLHALGLEYRKMAQDELALQAFQQVLESDANYLGTYYHLAKTYEALQLPDQAIEVYQKGIEIALAAKDLHARNELQMALDEITDE